MIWALFVVSVVAVLVSLGLFICRTQLIPFPFPDDGFRIFSCIDERAMEVVVQILADNGLKPGWRLDSGYVRRVMMKDRKTIVNCAHPDLMKELGNSAGTIAIPVLNPRKSGYEAERFLRKLEYRATAGPLLEVPGKPEAMFYLISNAFPNGMIIFRWHMLKMGKPDFKKYVPEVR